MFRLWNKRYFFCNAPAPKNYSSLFKLRPRLAEFFKHVHPDQMNQAPTKIRDENLRSLKNFNSYIDSINSEKPIEGKLLKFYISEKTNNKSKKFYSFEIELPEITQQRSVLTHDKAHKFFDDIVNAFNSKFQESRYLHDKKGKGSTITINDSVSFESEEEKANRLHESIGPFSKKRQRINEKEMKELESNINAKYVQSEKDALLNHLRKNMVFANTPSNKPMMWGRILMEEAGTYQRYQEILDNLIDPKLIYFDEKLTFAEIETFKRKLLPGDRNRTEMKDSHAIFRVCQEMESFSPPLCFYVSKHYSGNEIPGFFTVPFHFQALELLSKFNEMKSQIQSEKQHYETLYDYYIELEKNLKTRNQIKVRRMDFRNVSHINEIILMMQRLQKYSFSLAQGSNQPIEAVVLERDEFAIFCKEYRLNSNQTVHFFKEKLYMVAYFQDEHLLLYLKPISFKSHTEGTH